MVVVVPTVVVIVGWLVAVEALVLIGVVVVFGVTEDFPPIVIVTNAGCTVVDVIAVFTEEVIGADVFADVTTELAGGLGCNDVFVDVIVDADGALVGADVFVVVELVVTTAEIEFTSWSYEYTHARNTQELE